MTIINKGKKLEIIVNKKNIATKHKGIVKLYVKDKEVFDKLDKELIANLKKDDGKNNKFLTSYIQKTNKQLDDSKFITYIYDLVKESEIYETIGDENMTLKYDGKILNNDDLKQLYGSTSNHQLKNVYLKIAFIIEYFLKNIHRGLMLQYISFLEITLQKYKNLVTNDIVIKDKVDMSVYEKMLKIFYLIYRKIEAYDDKETDYKKWLNFNKQIINNILNYIYQYTESMYDDDADVIVKCKLNEKIMLLTDINIMNMNYIFYQEKNKKIIDDMKEIYTKENIKKILDLYNEKHKIMSGKINRLLSSTDAKLLKVYKLRVCQTELIEYCKISKIIFYSDKIISSRDINEEFKFSYKLKV